MFNSQMTLINDEGPSIFIKQIWNRSEITLNVFLSILKTILIFFVMFLSSFAPLIKKETSKEYEESSDDEQYGITNKKD